MDSKAQSLRIRIRQNASVKEKTLIRVVAETLKKLVQYYQVKNAEEILSSLDIQALRYKLKECLNRLIFLEPLEFGQKAEDTIWKSIFYEPIRIFKRELKIKPSIVNSKSLLLVAFQRHLLGAIGYYQKLILRLQTEFDLHEEMSPDFKRFYPCDNEDEKEVSPELKSWAFSCIQHSLLYIGDLYRYEHEIKCTNSRLLAMRYYNLVLTLNPSLGHAYNQLATLDTMSYYGLNGAYYYLKAQLCSNSFSQAKDNLLILFERNGKRLRNVLDRESSMKKSGCNIPKSGLKIIRVKTCIIKYLNVWHLFSTSNEMNHCDTKHLAAMSDDVLNILSFVLGFDRKLISNVASSDNGVRPSTLNVKIVIQLLFVSSSCLELMRPKKDQDTDIEANKKQFALKFDLAHSFVLNLYGHLFNQCLVRIRDELRASNIDISLLFRRYENNKEVPVITENCDEICSNKSALTTSPDQNIVKLKKKRVGLSKRLVRVRHDTDDMNNEEDLSEDDQNLSENDNLLWDDQISGSSDSDGDDNERGFGFSDGDDETDFESNEEIHSQDEDDQIIRAIVGHNTVFGRNQSLNGKDNKKSKDKESTNNSFVNKVIFSEEIIDESGQNVKPPKRRSAISQGPNSSLNIKPSPEILVPCVYNVDLLQSLSVVFSAFHNMKDDMLDSFLRVWQFAPYLWKHFAVMLNFCENVLDDLEQNNISSVKCNHVSENIRSIPSCILPEDNELNLEKKLPNNKDNVRCENSLHQIITRISRILRCGHWLASLPHSPIALQQSNSSNLWLFSYSHNAPRTNLVFKSWMQIFTTVDSQIHNNPIPSSATPLTTTSIPITSAVASSSDKEKVMREMARLRLKNELSSSAESDDSKDPESYKLSKKSRSPSNDVFRAVYLIADVEYICNRLDIIKALIKCQRYIFVIPQAVIQRLDKIKNHDHGARQAIKYFEGEMKLNNELIKIESIASLRTQDIACEYIIDWPAIETTASRLVDESVIKSVLSYDIVVTILTNSTSKLSNQFIDHYTKKHINFQSNIDF